jgi:excisionase family DNA binding protein
MGAQSISSRRAIHPLNSLQRFSAHREVSDGHHVVDSGARLALVKAFAPLDPRYAGFGLDNRPSSARIAFTCWPTTIPFSNRGAMRKRTTSPGGRLMDLRTAAAYLGCSYWTLRDLVLNGHIPAVRIPSPRARDGRVLRRILIDSRDLERLIERWKEVDDTAPTAMHP